MTSYTVSGLAFVLAANARILGMHAENMQRAAVGASMAYTEEAFAFEAAALEKLAIDIRNQG